MLSKRKSAALGSAAFFVAGPIVGMGLVPWRLTRWVVGTRYPAPLRWAGAGLIAAGSAVVASAFTRFVREGQGTPVPVAAPEHLVVGGIYRHVRNPMYFAGQMILLGQTLVLGRPKLLLYAMAVGAASASFAHWYEEPTLRDRFGAEYEAYRHAVPGWLPRLRPWEGYASPSRQDQNSVTQSDQPTLPEFVRR